jgi:hypothetical protein
MILITSFIHTKARRHIFISIKMFLFASIKILKLKTLERKLEPCESKY